MVGSVLLYVEAVVRIATCVGVLVSVLFVCGLARAGELEAGVGLDSALEASWSLGYRHQVLSDPAERWTAAVGATVTTSAIVSPQFRVTGPAPWGRAWEATVGIDLGPLDPSPFYGLTLRTTTIANTTLLVETAGSLRSFDPSFGAGLEFELAEQVGLTTGVSHGIQPNSWELAASIACAF